MMRKKLPDQLVDELLTGAKTEEEIVETLRVSPEPLYGLRRFGRAKRAPSDRSQPLRPDEVAPGSDDPPVAAHQPVCCFVSGNEARFSRQEDSGSSRIEAERDNGLGESGIGEGHELLGGAKHDRLVARKAPETPDRASYDLFGWPRAQQNDTRRELRSSGASAVGTSRRAAVTKPGSERMNSSSRTNRTSLTVTASTAVKRA